MLEYAVEMAEPIKTDLESQVRLWIKRKNKETSRLEFKQKVDLSTPGAKAEFIRDVIALANSEGENPRDVGHLVIGLKDGRFHEHKTTHYDGATFGQILDSYIFPAVNYAYEEFSFAGRGRVGVLIIKPDTKVLYVVNKKMQDNDRVLLSPGECFERKSDRKVELSGEAIHGRLRDIVESRIDDATDPLKTRIKKLEHQSGPDVTGLN